MLAPGTTLGPYRIVAPLGAGGMGEVYRARDTRLARDVAVKVIPAALAGDRDRVLRFEQEARAAGALSHPNVIVIHDIGEHEGSPFVVMELLEGETLRERLAHGPLPPRKAADVACQAAQGLAAAHEMGIVHRDLKPENLFLTKDGRVKVLDFGLAKLTRPEVLAPAGEEPLSVADTETGTVLGTAGYMAPEQVRGRPADQRSDLFALGAILYEMLTGRRAFRGKSSVETMHAILTEEPPSLSADREIPSGLTSVVEHCLEKVPEERFQNARDLAYQLRGLSSEVSASRVSARAFGEPRWRWPWLAAAAALVAVLAVATFLLWRGLGPRPVPSLEPRRVVVAVFENQTGDPSLDPLGRMVSDWLTQGLSRIHGLEVVPSTSVLFAQPAGRARDGAGGDPVRALALQTQAGIVVSGAYYLQGGRLELQARVVDAARDRLLQALEPVSGSREAPMGAIDSLRQLVMGAVAVHVEAVADFGTQQNQPRYDAYREFIAGFEVYMTDPAQGLRHFERAAELDPGFSTPLFYEAFLLDRAGDTARVADIVRRLSARRDEMPSFGAHWLDAIVAYHEHRYAESLQHTRAAEQGAPRDPITVLWIGYMAKLSNHPQETVAAYDAFGPAPYPGHAVGAEWANHLCEALHMLARYPRELEEARKAGVQRPEMLRPIEWQARALAALGRAGEVDRLVNECLASTAQDISPGIVMVTAATELRAHGYREASQALGARAAEWYRTRASAAPADTGALSYLAYSLCLAGQPRPAYDAYRSLVGLAPHNADYLGRMGCVAARLGRRDEALRIGEELRLMARPYLFGAHTYRRACIAALLGEKRQAVELLRQSFAEGVPFGIVLHRDMDLESLRDDPGFKELLRPKG